MWLMEQEYSIILIYKWIITILDYESYEFEFLSEFLFNALSLSYR